MAANMGASAALQPVKKSFNFAYYSFINAFGLNF
jgi:hypothetical protein